MELKNESDEKPLSDCRTRDPFSPLVRLTGYKPAAHLNTQTSLYRQIIPTSIVMDILCNRVKHFK
jgi:hypothetical protein